MLDQEKQKYLQIREKADIFYKDIKQIRCPALNNELIHFSSEGFNHLIYKGKRRERDKKVQIMKFKLLPKAKTIISISTTFQEYDEMLTSVVVKKKKKKVKVASEAKYWGFIAIIDNFRVKVIIRQIGKGKKQFWSVIPAWSTNYYRNIKLIKQFKGDLVNE